MKKLFLAMSMFGALSLTSCSDSGQEITPEYYKSESAQGHQGPPGAGSGREDPRDTPPTTVNHKICTELHYNSGGHNNSRVQIALPVNKLWESGRTLKVKFMGGSSYVREKVIKYAKEWEKYANIRFHFVTSGNADIRVSFVWGDGAWSYVGTDAENISSSKATMNFGGFNSYTIDSEFSRAVLHEFGHALGAIHEHQSPVANIPWNKTAVYNYYAKNGWSKATVDHNIFRRYDDLDMTNSSYDRHSIMHYNIPNSLTLGNFSVSSNTILSDTDKNFIAKAYPMVRPTNVRTYWSDEEEGMVTMWNQNGNKDNIVKYLLYRLDNRGRKILYSSMNASYITYQGVRKEMSRSYEDEISKSYISRYRIWVAEKNHKGLISPLVEAVNLSK